MSVLQVSSRHEGQVGVVWLIAWVVDVSEVVDDCTLKFGSHSLPQSCVPYPTSSISFFFCVSIICDFNGELFNVNRMSRSSSRSASGALSLPK